MAAGYYDINAQQHSTLNFHLKIYDDNGIPINLAGYFLRLQVRSNNNSEKLYLSISNSGIITGGSTGEFGVSGGVGGVGGASLNKDEFGNGFTGGVLFSADAVSMGYVRAGSWKYSIDAIHGGGSEELLSGQFIVAPKITKLQSNYAPGLTLDVNSEIFGNVVFGSADNLLFFYIGAFNTAPSVRRNGTAIQNGDLYWNLTQAVMLVYANNNWVNFEAGAIAAYNNTLQFSTTASTFSGLAQTAAIQAQAAKDVAVLGVRGMYTNIADAISYGLNAVYYTQYAGAGGIDGLYTFPVPHNPNQIETPFGTGGSISISVSGGTLQSIVVASRGNYYSATPQINFHIPGSPGGSYYGGFSSPPIAYLNVTKNVGPQEYFTVPSSVNTSLLDLYQVSSNGYASTFKDSYPNSTAVASLTNPNWVGKINGWVDPFFRYTRLDNGGTFLNRKRMWQQDPNQSLSNHWSLSSNTLFDGFSLNYRSNSTVTFSGPAILLVDDLSLVVSNAFTVSFLITIPPNVTFNMYGKFSTLASYGESPVAAGGGVQQFNVIQTASGGANGSTLKYSFTTNCPNTTTYPYFVTYCTSTSTTEDVKIQAMWAVKGQDTVTYPSFQGVETTEEIIKEVDLKIGALYSRFSWEGKINGWYDPYFRDTALFPNSTSGNKLMYWDNGLSSNFDSWSIVDNPIYDGKAIKKTNSTSVTKLSGPRIWISDLGFQTGDPISVSMWIVKSTGSTASVRSYGNWYNSSNQNIAGVNQVTGVLDDNQTTDLTPTLVPQRITISTTVPAGASFLWLYPIHNTGITQSFLIAALAATKTTFATSPLFPPLSNDPLYLDNKIKTILASTQSAIDITSSTFSPISGLTASASVAVTTGDNFSSSISSGGNPSVFSGWGSNYSYPSGASLGFNAVNVAVANTPTTNRIPWSSIKIVVKKHGALSTNLPNTATGVVVAVGSVNVDPVATSLTDLRILLKSPTSGLPITLTEADLINSSFAAGSQYYYIGIYARTAQDSWASLGTIHGEMSNKFTILDNSASDSYYITNGNPLTGNWAQVTPAQTASSRINEIGVAHLRLTAPVETVSYTPTGAVVSAVASAIGVITTVPFLVIPEKFYGLQVPDNPPGATAEIYNFYFDNMFIGDESYKYSVGVVDQSYSYKIFDRSLQWKPKGDIAQNYPFNIALRDKTTGDAIPTGLAQSIILGGLKKTSLVSVDVMVIGDSLVDYGFSTQQLLTLSSGSSLNITLRGTRETSSNVNRHEGRGGWKISDYYNVASLNGYNNPFRNPSSELFDFPYYLTQFPTQALTTTTKWVIFSLGINDSFGSTTDAGVLSTFNTSMTKLAYMIASVKISYPTVKIGIVLPSPPAAEQNAFGTAYDAGYSRIRVKRNIGLWSKYLISYFPYSGIANNNPIIIPSNVYLDTKYNFPTAATLVNSYNPLTELRQTDALHPTVYGGKQIGDCMFAVINYFST